MWFYSKNASSSMAEWGYISRNNTTATAWMASAATTKISSMLCETKRWILLLVNSALLFMIVCVGVKKINNNISLTWSILLAFLVVGWRNTIFLCFNLWIFINLTSRYQLEMRKNLKQEIHYKSFLMMNVYLNRLNYMQNTNKNILIIEWDVSYCYKRFSRISRQ